MCPYTCVTGKHHVSLHLCSPTTGEHHVSLTLVFSNTQGSSFVSFVHESMIKMNIHYRLVMKSEETSSNNEILIKQMVP